jgi:hypothetical protein
MWRQVPQSGRALLAVGVVTIASMVGVAAALGSGIGLRLSSPERHALEVRSLSVSATGRALRADVRLSGDLQRRIGQGNLRNAAIGLVLRSRTHGRPAIVISILGQLANSRAVAGEANGGRLPRGLHYAVVRNRDRVAFSVIGVPVSGLASVEVDTLVWPSSARTPGRQAVITAFVKRNHVFDRQNQSLTLLSSPPPCATLESELTEARTDVSRLQTTAGQIKTSLGQLSEELAEGLITQQQYDSLSSRLNQDLINVNTSESQIQTVLIPALEQQIQQDSCPST